MIRDALERLAPPTGGALRARLRRGLGRAWLFALLAALCLLYAYIVQAGTHGWPIYGVYHDLQANGFLSGHLYLPIEPDPKLLAAKNPHDYSLVSLWWLDASLYHGKYYIYWGPVPALVDAAAKWVLGIRASVGDQFLALGFHCLAAIAGALVVERMLRRLFASQSRLWIAFGTLVFALANPAPHGVATASTYQTAIIAAQAWLYVGLVFAFDAVWHAGSERARFWRLPLAGAAWALALGSRVSVCPAVALLCLLTALAEAWPSTRRGWRFVGSAFSVGLPVLAGSLGLLLYNELRFDSWLEFGSKLQLSAFPLRFDTSYILANLYSYALRPADLECAFPYVYQEWSPGLHAFPHGFPLPHGYMILEPVVGWALAVPLTWLMPLAFLLAPRPSRFRFRRDRTYLFCLLSFTTLATAAGALTLAIYGATMRYLADVSYGLVLLALLGGYALVFHRVTRHLRFQVAALVGLLGAATMVIGLLLGYQGYNAHFWRYNPKLDARLVNALSFCPSHPSAHRPKWEP